MRIAAAVVLGIGLARPGLARGATPEARCQAGKNQAAGRYAACLQKARKKLVLSGDVAKFDAAVAKCRTKFTTRWATLELKAIKKGSTCPTTGDGETLATVLEAHAACIAGALATGDQSCFPSPGPIERLDFGPSATIIDFDALPCGPGLPALTGVALSSPTALNGVAAPTSPPPPGCTGWGATSSPGRQSLFFDGLTITLDAPVKTNWIFLRVPGHRRDRHAGVRNE